MAVAPGQFLKCRHEYSTKETNMTTQFTTTRANQTLCIILIAVCCSAILTRVNGQKPEAMKVKSQYQVSSLPTLGGTSNAGNSINNQSWVAGYSRLTGNQSRHAALWRNGSLSDLGTLGLFPCVSRRSSPSTNLRSDPIPVDSRSSPLSVQGLETWRTPRFCRN